jgi:hypothetical protein
MGVDVAGSRGKKHTRWHPSRITTARR